MAELQFFGFIMQQTFYCHTEEVEMNHGTDLLKTRINIEQTLVYSVVFSPECVHGVINLPKKLALDVQINLCLCQTIKLSLLVELVTFDLKVIECGHIMVATCVF